MGAARRGRQFWVPPVAPRAPWDGGERWCRDPLGNLGMGVGCWPWCPRSSPSSPSPVAVVIPPGKGPGGCDLLQPTVH